MGHPKEPSAYAVLNKSGSAIRIWWSGSERERAERIAAEDFDSKLTALYSDDVIRDIEMQRDDLSAELEESDSVRNRLAALLSDTAIALKGEEAELQRHSWHDLPVVALAAMIEIEMLKGHRDDLLAALEKLQRRLSACAEYFDGANESSIRSWLDIANIAIASAKDSA